jgi:predicted LPLAT superfamily acyltransferase
MGFYASRDVEVMELASEGYNPYSIATMLNVPVIEVFSILNREDMDYEVYDQEEPVPYNEDYA